MIQLMIFGLRISFLPIRVYEKNVLVICLFFLENGVINLNFGKIEFFILHLILNIDLIYKAYIEEMKR